MLKYMILATSDLVATAVLIGLLLALLCTKWPGTGRKYGLVGGLCGFAVALVVAILKLTTNIVDTPLIETWLGFIAFIALIVFLVCSIKPVANKLGRVADHARMVALAATMFCRLVFTLPAVFMYPQNFNDQGNGLASTDFVYRVIGMIIGLVLIVVIIGAVYKVVTRLSERKMTIIALLGAIVLDISMLMTAVQTLMVRHIIGRTAFTFNLVKHDDSEVFTYIMIALAVIAAILLLMDSFKAKEPYDNPAQHRKIRAKWRNRRRWSAALIICAIIAILNITVFEAIDSREVELSPTEDCIVEDDSCVVPFEQVEDGHLHRFKYTTDDGKNLRFIVIKKPNSQAYGVGLDACDICGETGYFERDGQVVCKLCDVVMNINTIGFKGGCNPIVIDYEVKDSKIIVPIDSLLEYKDVFTGKFD